MSDTIGEKEITDWDNNLDRTEIISLEPEVDLTAVSGNFK